MLCYIERGLMPNTGKRFEWEVGVASHNALAATFQDYDWADEVLQFSLRDSRIISTVVGLSRPERITETLALALQPIAEEFWKELAEVREKAAHEGRSHSGD